ncbi:MAG TPA: carboxypeptidase-like regulatory domain-containing protein [Bryobacteraceae bacterium]|nr:carboxypeptidase-like regulatory domain-containing protein [Bryobacteraceae bacterium]
MRSFVSGKNCICLLACLLAAVPSALAQNVTGTIVGTVRDASGGGIQSVSITVTNQGTNVEFKTTTGSSGEYVAPGLGAGSYSVKAEAAGFRQALAKDLVLLPNRTARQDFTLEVGAVQQSVEVTAAAPLVNSENATIGNVMQSQQVTTLPLNGRYLDRLIRISAGVTTDSASNPRVAGSSYWGGVSFNVDGAAFNDPGNGGGAYTYRNGMATLPSVDVVSEFKIDSNNQKAEFEGATAITITTKSGTNELHGSAYEFNRNKAYAARNFFSPVRPPYNRNEFGFAAGGPIRRDKTFLFGGYEALRERASSTYTLSVATPAMRNGNFSGLPAILDPLAGTPFPNNQIPANRIDPRSTKLINYVLLPNLPGTGPAGTINNLVVNNPNNGDINRFFVRVDHHFSEKDTFWANFSSSKSGLYTVAQAYPTGYGSWGDGGFFTQVANGTWQHNFSPRMLNEARFAYLYHGSVRLGMNTDFDPRSIFPDLYGPLPEGGLPNINFGTGHVAIGDYGGSARGKQFTRQIIDNLTMIRGSHTFKTGFDIANFRVSSPPGAFGLLTSIAQNAGLGRFDFSGRFTNSNPSQPAQPAHAFADFLLGDPAFTYRSTPTAVNLFYQTRYSAYIQDDWQVTPNFTLNFGVRWMMQSTWKERDLAQANLDFATNKLVIPRASLPPQALPRLASTYPIVTDPNATVLKPDKRNFAPRLGFAYRPFHNNRTVIRGGAGMYYNILPVYIGFRQMGFSNPPFLLSETFEAAPGPTPSLTLAQPFPGAGALSPNPSITAVQQDIHNSVSQQWNFTVEHELSGNLGVRASYIGNKTSHLPYYNNAINVPAVQVPGTLQSSRPYQPWSDILLLNSAGDSTLHQLQLEAIKRMGHGLNFQIEYSWNRSLDDTPIVGAPQNPYDNRGSRGNSDQVRRHVFTAAYYYELPFGPGKRFANVKGAAGKLIGGWNIAGITSLRTGQPFSVTFSPSLPGWIGSRADVVNVGALPRGERSISRWFDPSGYVVPAPYTYGNSARNLLFGPGQVVFDVSVLKDTSITERVKVQFRAEFFNMPNHANFQNPAANISSPSNVGKITGADDPRQIQFGLKLLF